MLLKKTPFPITGMGMITPAGDHINALWERCLDKKSFIHEGLGKMAGPEIEKAWKKIVQSPWIKEKPKLISKSLVYSLHSIIEAVEGARWENFFESDVLLIGTTTGQISLWEHEILTLQKTFTEEKPNLEKLLKHPMNSLAEDLKKALHFPGKIIILTSACSASTQALIAAYDFLASNRAGRCIAGGSEELSELTVKGFNCLKLLNLAPCKPFDQSRVGINLSEGAAFYTVEKKSEQNPLAYLYAGETVLDSFHMTSPEPSGMGLQKAMLKTLQKNNLLPEDISVIHAHGTGSIQNDQAEANAINALFTNHPQVLSTKGVHGHALGASGAIELGICIKMLSEQLIAPITGLSIMDEAIALNLSTESKKQKIEYLLKNTLGFGGVNSSLILGSAHA